MSAAGENRTEDNNYEEHDESNCNDQYTSDNIVIEENKVNKKVKDRTYKYKIIKGLSYKNNYKKICLNPVELKFWLEKDKEHKDYAESQFKCDKCILGFGSEKKYDNHIKTHHSKVIFVLHLIINGHKSFKYINHVLS